MNAETKFDVEKLLDTVRLPAFVHCLKARRILMSNAEFQRLMGYSREEVQAMLLDDLRLPEDVPFLLRHLTQDPPDEIFKRRWLTGKGELIWVDLKYRNMLYVDAEGNVLDTRFVVIRHSEPASSQGAADTRKRGGG